jgi:hypothetical protein
MGRNLWPMVAMVGMGLTAVVTILIFVPVTNATGAVAVTAILGFVGSMAAAAHVTSHVRDVKDQVAQVKEQVNGNLTRLINAKTQPDAPAQSDIPDEPKEHGQ